MDELDTPNCPACLVPMESAEVGRTVEWRCPECGLVKVADSCPEHGVASVADSFGL